jgi:hypothetical protein
MTFAKSDARQLLIFVISGAQMVCREVVFAKSAARQLLAGIIDISAESSSSSSARRNFAPGAGGA